MVRVKHRYLLVEILYPEPASWTATKPPSKAGSTAQTQAQLRIHSPTSDALTPSVLARMLREEVDNMFGDWGVGRLGGVNAGGVSGSSSIFVLPDIHIHRHTHMPHKHMPHRARTEMSR